MPAVRQISTLLPSGIFPTPIEQYREYMENALNAYIAGKRVPPKPGYEDDLRRFTGAYFIKNVPGLAGLLNAGPRIYYPGGFLVPDMLIAHSGLPVDGQMKFMFKGDSKIVDYLFEWGHDHAWSVKGCVNKPITDFIKWYRLFNPSGPFKQIPLCCIQIATDFTGTFGTSWGRIHHSMNRSGLLTDEWEMTYPGFPTVAKLYMTYYAPSTNFTTIYAGVPAPFYAADLAVNFSHYYLADKKWPLTKCIDPSTRIDALSIL